MLDHLGVQVADVEASASFYRSLLAPLGIAEGVRFPVGESAVVGLAGAERTPTFWLSPAQGVETRELHVAFTAPDRAAVDAIYENAVAAGAEILHGPGSGPNTTPATTACLCVTLMVTTSRQSSMAGNGPWWT